MKPLVDASPPPRMKCAFFYMRLDAPRRGQMNRDGIPQPIAYAYLTRREVWKLVWDWTRVGLRRDMGRGLIYRNPFKIIRRKLRQSSFWKP
jgi:hypothetical protein